MAESSMTRDTSKIDEILNKYDYEIVLFRDKSWLPKQKREAEREWHKIRETAKQAITEHIKEIIGEDEVPATQEFGLDPEEVFMPSDIIRDVRNDLRAEQRKRLEM